MPKTTLGELMSTLEWHQKYRTDSGGQGVVIRFNHTFFEMSVKQHDELKAAVSKKLMLIANGVEEPDPITTFALQLLAETH